MARFWRTWREQRAADPIAEQRQRISDYRTVFGSEAGQRVLADLGRRAQIMQCLWAPDGAEANAFRLGQRYTVLQIIEMINADPDAMNRAATTGETQELFHDDVG